MSQRSEEGMEKRVGEWIDSQVDWLQILLFRYQKNISKIILGSQCCEAVAGGAGFFVVGYGTTCLKTFQPIFVISTGTRYLVAGRYHRMELLVIIIV